MKQFVFEVFFLFRNGKEYRARITLRISKHSRLVALCLPHGFYSVAGHGPPVFISEAFFDYCFSFSVCEFFIDCA